MLNKKRKTTILLDFLLVVIITITILISMLTYFNIKTGYKILHNELSKRSEYIVRILNEDVENAIKRSNFYKLNNLIEKLLGKNGDIYKIMIQKLVKEDELEIIYSNQKEEIGNILKIKNLNSRFLEEKVLKGESRHEDITTYDYIYPMMENEKIIGVLNIVISLKEVKKYSKKMMIGNLIISIISLIIIIAVTTIMLMKRIYNPINKIREEVRKIKEGEISYEINLNVHNELESLAEEIDDLKGSVWERTLEDRFAHPITGLPGLMSVIEKINEMIEKDKFFGLLSLELKNTEPYILSYGLANGEDILRFISQLIQETLESQKIEKKVLTQVRENHFILIMGPDEIKKVGEEIVKKFDKEVLSLYGEEENSGYISFKNKKGEDKKYPIMSVTIVGLDNKIRGELLTYKDVEDRIMEIEKEYYEVQEGSLYINYEEGKNTKRVEPKKENKEKKIETDDDLLSGLEEMEDD